MVDRELGDQRQPHVARLAESVEQNDRRTGAGLEVVQSHAVDRGEAAMHRLGQERGRREDDQNEQQKHPACGSEHEPYLDVSRHSIPCHSVALLTCATPTGLSRRRRQGTIEASVTAGCSARARLSSPLSRGPARALPGREGCRPGRTRRSWACYWLALSMIRAMSCAREMKTRCPVGSSVTRAFIRFAMKRSSSGLIARSCVATTYHDGTVFQAGATVSGSPSALPAIGFCAVANAPGWVGGRPLANTSGYFAPSM